MEASQKGYAHHFIPKRPNGRLVVVHHGHAPSFNDDPTPQDVGHGMRRTISGLLTDGYSVLAVYVPHIVKFSTRLTVDDNGSVSHDGLFKRVKVKHGSPMKFFLEPVAVCLRYLKTKSSADGFPEYRDFATVGLSGGGWTTAVYAAIDPTIRLSFPVAGSMPLYLWPRTPAGYSMGDAEQTLGAFYQIAGYPDRSVDVEHVNREGVGPVLLVEEVTRDRQQFRPAVVVAQLHRRLGGPEAIRHLALQPRHGGPPPH
jgi:hypothetical protein